MGRILIGVPDLPGSAISRAKRRGLKIGCDGKRL